MPLLGHRNCAKNGANIPASARILACKCCPSQQGSCIYVSPQVHLLFVSNFKAGMSSHTMNFHFKPHVSLVLCPTKSVDYTTIQSYRVCWYAIYMQLMLLFEVAQTVGVSAYLVCNVMINPLFVMKPSMMKPPLQFKQQQACGSKFHWSGFLSACIRHTMKLGGLGGCWRACSPRKVLQNPMF